MDIGLYHLQRLLCRGEQTLANAVRICRALVSAFERKADLAERRA